MSNVDGAAAPGTTPATPAAPPAGGTPPAAGATPAAAPPAGGSPPPPAGTTLAGQPPPGEGVPYWPQDWRERLSGTDEARKNILARFTTPEALVEKMINQEQVIRSRPAAPPPKPGPEATAEEKAAWYKAAGLPAEPAGYMETLQLSEGKVLGEADMPVANHFFERMHEIGAPKEIVSAAVDSVLEYMEEDQNNRIAEDHAFRQQSRDQLRDMWQGPEYKRNMSFIAPAFGQNVQLKDAMLSARMPDGRLVGDHPEVIEWLVNVGRQMDPDAAVASGGLLTLQSIDTEIATLKDMMKDDNGPYYRGNQAPIHQARFKALLDQKEAIERRQSRRSA